MIEPRREGVLGASRLRRPSVWVVTTSHPDDTRDGGHIDAIRQILAEEIIPAAAVAGGAGQRAAAPGCFGRAGAGRVLSGLSIAITRRQT